MIVKYFTYKSRKLQTDLINHLLTQGKVKNKKFFFPLQLCNFLTGVLHTRSCWEALKIFLNRKGIGFLKLAIIVTWKAVHFISVSSEVFSVLSWIHCNQVNFHRPRKITLEGRQRPPFPNPMAGSQSTTQPLHTLTQWITPAFIKHPLPFKWPGSPGSSPPSNTDRVSICAPALGARLVPQAELPNQPREAKLLEGALSGQAAGRVPAPRVQEWWGSPRPPNARQGTNSAELLCLETNAAVRRRCLPATLRPSAPWEEPASGRAAATTRAAPAGCPPLPKAQRLAKLGLSGRSGLPHNSGDALPSDPSGKPV